MTLKEIYHRARTSRVWTIVVPMLVGIAYSWWRYQRLLFWPSLLMVVTVAIVKLAYDWWFDQYPSHSIWILRLKRGIDVILPYFLIILMLFLNTKFKPTAGLLTVWFGIAFPLIAFSLSISVAKDVRKIRAEEIGAKEFQHAQSRASWGRPIFLLLPVLSYAEILLLTLSGYLPLLAWAMIVLFPLVFAQALTVGLESDLDKSADLPARNLFLTGLALVLVLVIAGA
ncbi:1 [Fructobacillus cardui]|uniref:hypothetical protein n=1 Tax=Fructobacillus cardui TaxID=2893170 RepID=UPI002D8FEFEE|nr:1 [Fructobacillus cardui] [Fructobacillus cardui]